MAGACVWGGGVGSCLAASSSSGRGEGGSVGEQLTGGYYGSAGVGGLESYGVLVWLGLVLV